MVMLFNMYRMTGSRNCKSSRQTKGDGIQSREVCGGVERITRRNGGD